MSSAIVPIPRTPVSVRPATMADFSFIDELQKAHRKGVGFLKRQAVEGKIAAGEVLVAVAGEQLPVASPVPELQESPATDNRQLATRLGYCMARDKYMKREDVGIISQMNVVDAGQRKLIGATLLKATFERAAYGCRLFSCWCAQDIAANRFWEAMGFVPLAYRVGARKGKRAARVHIFWQKRIRSGDGETPWWFPSETQGGAIGEGRIVLPIPIDRHWSDEMPVMVLPGTGKQSPAKELPVVSCQLPDQIHRRKSARATGNRQLATPRVLPTAMTGLRFGPPPVVPAVTTAIAKRKAATENKPREKNAPELIAAARELRDRWLERVNSGEMLIEDAGKYEVTRAIGAKPVAKRLGTPASKQLPMAA